MAQVRRIDGEFGCSLVCIGSVLSLAVVPTALQKLHKCVTQNTTELLHDTEGNKKEEVAFKNTLRVSAEFWCVKKHIKVALCLTKTQPET